MRQTFGRCLRAQSTLFNALCENGKAQAANFPFCTIEPNVGVVAVPDERLAVLSQLNSSAATVPTTVEFVDIAGLVKGASKGEGLGNKCVAILYAIPTLQTPLGCRSDIKHSPCVDWEADEPVLP